MPRMRFSCFSRGWCSRRGCDGFLSVLPAMLAIMVVAGLLVGILSSGPGDDALHRKRWAVYIFVMTCIVFVVIAVVSYVRYTHYRDQVDLSYVRNNVMVTYKSAEARPDVPYGQYDSCAHCKHRIRTADGTNVVEVPCCEQLFHHDCYEGFQKDRPYGVAWDKATRGEALSDEERDILHSLRDVCPFCADELDMITVIRYEKGGGTGASLDSPTATLRAHAAAETVDDRSIDIEMARLGVIREYDGGDDGSADDGYDYEDDDGEGRNSIPVGVFGRKNTDDDGKTTEDDDYILHLDEVKID